MAVLLDRSHQELDPVFGMVNKSGHCFNTCGSFAPIVFMRAGVPIVSLGYVTPTTTIVSLALQKILGFGNVKSVQFSQLSPSGVAKDIAIIVVHDGVLVSMEIGLYMLTLSELGTFLYSFF